jgi:hypothetical protein
MLPRNINYGKNINLMERLSDRHMSDLLEEAACFGSLKEYARDFVRIYNRGYRDVERFMTTLRVFAIKTRGRNWYRENFNIGERYLQVAAKWLGVSSYRVVEHIIENNIDISSLSHVVFSDDYIKAYNFFYTRCLRHQQKD